MKQRSLAGALALLVCVSWIVGCGSSSPVAPDQSAVAFSTTDLTVGTGPTAVAGMTVNVTYAGWLYSDTATDHKGAQFDANTFSFVLGAGSVIKGFDQGVQGMNVGGIRRIIMPPSLAYGSSGYQTIPPNAALVFDVQLNSAQ